MWLIFCDYAVVNLDDTLTMVRAGADVLTCRAFPGEATLSAAVFLKANTMSTNGPHQVVLTMINEANEPWWRWESSFSLDPADDFNFVIPIKMTLSGPGKHRAVLRIGNVEAEWPFKVVLEVVPDKEPAAAG